MSSNAALQKAKWLYRAEKAGHTGTLDPLASGLLPLCFGEATKFAQRLLDARKGYRATFRFGVTTTTGDAEGDIRQTRPVAITLEALQSALAQRLGAQMQTPPLYAALKFEGRAYYEHARAGRDVPRTPRPIVVHAFDLVEWRTPDAVVDIACSKGTYVRVLAEDVGEALGCGAHLAALRRTATGGFNLDDAVPLEALAAMSEVERDQLLLPSSCLVTDLPRLCVDADAGRRFRNGQALPAAQCADGDCAVFAGPALLGLAEVQAGVAHPRRVVSSRLAENTVFGL